LSDHAFDRLVQSCWDEGRDPVDDARVQQRLLAHPELLDGFAQWRAAVGALPLAASRQRKRRYWFAAAACVGLAAAAGWWSLLTGGAETGVEPGVVRFSVFETTTQRPGATVSWRERRTLVATPHTRFSITKHRNAIR